LRDRLASASKKTDRKQNRAIRQTAKALKKANAAIKALGDGSKGLDGRIKTIEDAAPVIISSLTQLSDAAKGLKVGLETAGANLTNLGSAYQSVEFGATVVRVGPGGAGGALPATAVSPDIPDDGNPATATMDLPVSVGPGPGQVLEDTLLTPRSAIRSAESDGNATGDPAGYVGGLVTMTCGGGPGAGGTCDTDPDNAVTNLVPPGAVLCVLGPPPNQNIAVPGVGSVPFHLVTIQQKVGRADQTKPDATSPNPDAGVTTATGTVIGPLGNEAGEGCKTGETGNTLLLKVQTQFVDIPTSATPGPTE
jgi:hypothetical protein